MGPKLEHILLHTKDKSTLANFLSELLEMEINNYSPEKVILHAEGMPDIGLLDADKNHLFARNSERDMRMSFEVSSLEELENLVHKMRFLSYRNGGEKIEQNMIQNESGKVHYFEVRDPDGRPWKFTCHEA